MSLSDFSHGTKGGSSIRLDVFDITLAMLVQWLTSLLKSAKSNSPLGSEVTYSDTVGNGPYQAQLRSL
jgi:hypothetical protein